MLSISAIIADLSIPCIILCIAFHLTVLQTWVNILPRDQLRPVPPKTCGYVKSIICHSICKLANIDTYIVTIGTSRKGAGCPEGCCRCSIELSCPWNGSVTWNISNKDACLWDSLPKIPFKLLLCLKQEPSMAGCSLHDLNLIPVAIGFLGS